MSQSNGTSHIAIDAAQLAKLLCRIIEDDPIVFTRLEYQWEITNDLFIYRNCVSNIVHKVPVLYYETICKFTIVHCIQHIHCGRYRQYLYVLLSH